MVHCVLSFLSGCCIVQARCVLLTHMSPAAQISALEGEPALESLLAISIEMAAFSSSQARPGRSSIVAQCAQQQAGHSNVSHYYLVWTGHLTSLQHYMCSIGQPFFRSAAWQGFLCGSFHTGQKPCPIIIQGKMYMLMLPFQPVMLTQVDNVILSRAGSWHAPML